jgi:hypothetical protein
MGNQSVLKVSEHEVQEMIQQEVEMMSQKGDSIEQ